LQVHRSLAPPGARALAGRRALGMEAEIDVLAPRADARVQVEIGDAARMAEVRLYRLAKCVVCPLRLRTAIEDAVGMRVLPAVEGVRERLLADALAKRVQPREDGLDRGLIPGLQQDLGMNLGVAGIRRHRPGEVDEVPVQVDVLLGDARLVREAPRVL